MFAAAPLQTNAPPALESLGCWVAGRAGFAGLLSRADRDRDPVGHGDVSLTGRPTPTTRWRCDRRHGDDPKFQQTGQRTPQRRIADPGPIDPLARSDLSDRYRAGAGPAVQEARGQVGPSDPDDLLLRGRTAQGQEGDDAP